MKTEVEPPAERSFALAAPLAHSREDSNGGTDAGCRPLDYWLPRYPPGWTSRLRASEAEPVELAIRIHLLAADFVKWLRLPNSERWDTFGLQVLSAKLFSRFRGGGKPARGMPADVGILELTWPKGSEAVRRCLRELQELLAPPLAVYKAVRSAAGAAEFPTNDEMIQADSALLAARDEIAATTERLATALAQYEVTRLTVGDPMTVCTESSAPLNRLAKKTMC